MQVVVFLFQVLDRNAETADRKLEPFRAIVDVGARKGGHADHLP